MYDYFRGKLIEKTPTYAVIECGGVGYILNISNIYKNNPRKLIELTFYLIHDKDYLKEEALKGFLDDFICD